MIQSKLILNNLAFTAFNLPEGSETPRGKAALHNFIFEKEHNVFSIKTFFCKEETVIDTLISFLL